MKSYRIYTVGPGGRLQLGLAFEADSDEHAAERALTLAGRGGMITELWEGGRLVGRTTKTGGFRAEGEA